MIVVADEPTIGKRPNKRKSQKGQRLKSIKAEQEVENREIRFWIWISGLVISFIPLLWVPLKNLFASGFNLEDLKVIFGGKEIILIAISMLISALNDFLSNKKKQKKTVLGTLAAIIYIFIGAVAYGILESESSTDFKITPYLLVCNILYLLFAIILGVVQYTVEIKEAKKWIR